MAIQTRMTQWKCFPSRTGSEPHKGLEVRHLRLAEVRHELSSSKSASGCRSGRDLLHAAAPRAAPTRRDAQTLPETHE